MLRETAYWASQNARTAFFLGQYLIGRSLAASQTARRRPVISRQLLALLADVRALQRRDLANVKAGHYGLPDDIVAPPLAALESARAYFADLPEVAARRMRNGYREVRDLPEADNLPAYYARNFHYQTGGYLTRHSARLYDHQVEVLFMGAADAMRRQALVPVSEWLRGRRSDGVRLLDVACGTGRFLAMLKDTWPRLPVTGLDLSVPYLQEARSRLQRATRLHLVQGLAEALPVADASVDLVTCLYLFHEVPGPVRQRMAAEFARVLRPGGRLVLVDSIQYGDRPDYDGMLDGFPDSFHEPFYAEYARTDLAALFEDVGLHPAGSTRAFLSKVVVCDQS